MKPNRRVRNGVLATAAMLAPFVGMGSAAADSEFEVGAFGGYHLFSNVNELGVADVPNANYLDDSLIVGLRLGLGFGGYFGFELEGGFIPSKVNALEPDVTVNVLAPRAHIVAHLRHQRERFRPFVVAGAGFQISSSDDEAQVQNDEDFETHAGAGFKLGFNDNIGVRADVRFYLVPSSIDDGVTNDYEATLGLYARFGEVSPPPPPPVVEPVDPDGDGIAGDADQCPNEAEDMDGYEDQDGCPEADNDGDGIPDANDQCPTEAETQNGIDDTDGCPETDEDGDGLFGSQDQCPTEAEDADGFQDEDGCPDPDNDGDGVADADDKCPEEQETANGYQDGDGCADEVPAAVAKFTGTIEGIYFATGKADIRARSFRVLNKAVKVLTEYEDVRMEIGGHTDNVGGEEINQQLSQDRADSVRMYFINKGIDESRLTAVGYGQTVPIADNATKVGRRQNRRVEFKLIQ